MNVLFLTLLDFRSFAERNIYCDLLREFIKNGHDVYCISPAERRTGVETHWEENGRLLKLRTGNTQKTNIVEKGLSTLLLEPAVTAAIRKHFCHVKFDLVLYSTPPITLQRAVAFAKKRDGARTYLLLKDIFPQNAVDLGMFSQKGLLYRYFRRKERQLYAVSDRIGCMSPANVAYVLRHNPEIAPDRVEVCPNSVAVGEMALSDGDKRGIRAKYGIPADKKVFVYGGNLGKPQGIPFLIECLQSQERNPDVFFLIVGDGTELGLLQRYFASSQPSNMKLLHALPKEEYDRLVASCDVGMIFLDHRFTIPNFPSRLLGYMQAGLPVLACTDPNTDIGQVIVDGGFGWWCESNDVRAFIETMKELLASCIPVYGQAAKRYLITHYNVAEGAKIIVNGKRSCDV